jgi:hypothetical protein
MIRFFLRILIPICFLLVLLLTSKAYSLDRCIEYTTDERAQGLKNFGPGYPYWYGLGQLQQESNCRANVTAFDLGQGIAQFMPKTAQYINSLMGKNLNPYNPHQAIQMQNYYMALIYRSQKKWSGKLWTSYQEYNGGLSNLYNEFKRARDLDWGKMKDQCHRKVITLKNGSKLDFCQVNYDYSKKVYKYGQQYRTSISENKEWKFW